MIDARRLEHDKELGFAADPAKQRPMTITIVSHLKALPIGLAVGIQSVLGDIDPYGLAHSALPFVLSCGPEAHVSVQGRRRAEGDLTQEQPIATKKISARSSASSSGTCAPFDNSVFAVSYTHLDVYKRQLNNVSFHM